MGLRHLKKNPVFMGSSRRPRKLSARDKLICPVLFLAAAASALIFFSFGAGGLNGVLKNMGFVGRNGTHFVLDNRPFYVNGWNSYWLMDQAVKESGMKRVRAVLRAGAEMGLTVCRTWAFNDGAHNALQVSLGRFDERVFMALDRVITEARRHKVRLLLSLANNMEAYGGKIQYVKWAWEEGIGQSSSNDSFFVDPSIRHYFKFYLKTILTRKNHMTGIEYREDPAIFGWELMNEPRCLTDVTGDTLQGWIEEMSAYVKSIDEKHLVTVGLEGFYGPTSPPEKLKVNPSEWASKLGVDFIRNSNISTIDFASVHVYPDHWLVGEDVSIDEKTRYAIEWMRSHIDDGNRYLKKPVFFSEVGLSERVEGFNLSHRVLFYESVLKIVLRSARYSEAVGGTAVWQMIADGMEQLNDGFGLNPLAASPIYKLMKEQSCRLAVIGKEEDLAKGKISRENLCGG